MINALAKAIVERLKDQLPGWDVDDFPNAPDRYGWAHQSQTLLVGFEGTTYGEPESLDPMSVTRELDMGVTILCRSLHGNLSIASALEDIRKTLMGWRPLDADGVPIGIRSLRPLSERFVDEVEGVYRFVALYRGATTCAAEILTLSGPPLKGISTVEKP